MRGIGMTLLVVAALISTCEATRAQGPPTGETKEALMARNVDPGWEVATVRPSDPDETEQSFSVRGRHVLIKRQNVETMLMVGYGVQKTQIADAPDWVKSQPFDVDGFPDAPGQPSVQQFQSMVRKLLVERFGLKMHKEQREMAAYVLTVAKGGMKLKPTKSDPNSLPIQDAHGGEAERQLKFTNVSMDDFALMMLYEVDKPLLNRTGLQGRYDFDLKFTKDESRVPPGTSSAPGLFTAIQEQLGLKLESVKAPVPVLVIDAVSRPSAN
jgi:uncharacterized protein (TIGR03435 family)